MVRERNKGAKLLDELFLSNLILMRLTELDAKQPEKRWNRSLIDCLLVFIRRHILFDTKTRLTEVYFIAHYFLIFVTPRLFTKWAEPNHKPNLSVKRKRGRLERDDVVQRNTPSHAKHYCYNVTRLLLLLKTRLDMTLYCLFFIIF